MLRLDQVFTAEEEGKMSTYILSGIYFGLLPIEITKVAYQCAVQLRTKNIFSFWHQNNMAGIGFKILAPKTPFSLRKPKATPLNRVTSFIKTFILSLIYFNDLSKNTSLPLLEYATLMKPESRTKKIVDTRRQKRVSAITSADRETLITLTGVCNAKGTFITITMLSCYRFSLIASIIYNL